MSTVSNTTPLRYLVFIGEEHVIPSIFGTVHVLKAVLDELMASKTPELEAVRRWAAEPPGWIAVQDPKHIDAHLAQKLDRGEAAAIALAKELRADRILVDERRGRNVAKQEELAVATTLGVLEEAAVRGYVDIEAAIDKLRATNYRAREQHYQQTIENVRRAKLVQEQHPEQKKEPQQDKDLGRSR